jgi:hypothetical protein
LTLGDAERLARGLQPIRDVAAPLPVANQTSPAPDRDTKSDGF